MLRGQGWQPGPSSHQQLGGAGRAMGRKEPRGSATISLEQAFPSHLLEEGCLPLGDIKQVQPSASAGPTDMLGGGQEALMPGG